MIVTKNLSLNSYLS